MNKQSLRPRRAPRHQRGFSLIEVLIGLLIAMIGVVIMMEVLMTAEERNRTTSTGNEAMSNGAVMMYMLQRDLVQAGYGINARSLLGCNTTLPAHGGIPAQTVPLAPVVINPPSSVVPTAGTSADTDRIFVFYGNDNGQPEGNEIFAIDSTTKQYTMQSPISFSVGDRVVAYAGGCAANLTLATVTAVNLATSRVTVDNITAGATILYNMGPAPRIVGYAVRGDALTSCDFLANNCSNGSAWAAIAGGIVSLRAQYGRDGSPPTWIQTAPTTVGTCDWLDLKSIRYALVARSTQFESAIAADGKRKGETVTSAAPIWMGTTAAADNPTPVPVVLSADPDWQSYRYKTFENIAPVRNVIWMKEGSGC